MKRAISLCILGWITVFGSAVFAATPNDLAGVWYRFQTELNASPSYHFYWFSPDGRFLEGVPSEGRYGSFDCATPRTKDEWQSCGAYSLKGSKIILTNAVTGKAESCNVAIKNAKLEVCGEAYTRLRPVKSGRLEGTFEHLSVYNGPTFYNLDGSSTVSGGQSRKSISFKKDGSFTTDRSSFGAFLSPNVTAYNGSSDSTGGSYTVGDGVLTLKFKEGATARFTFLLLDKENIFLDDTIYWQKGSGAGAKDVQTYSPAIARGSGKAVPKSYANPIRVVPFVDQLSQRDRSFIALSTVVNESDRDATLYWRCDGKALQISMDTYDILTDANSATPLLYRFDSGTLQQDFWTNPEKSEPRLEIGPTASHAFAPSSSVASLTQTAVRSKRLAVQTLEEGKPRNYVFDLTGFGSALQKLKCQNGFGGSRAAVGAFSVETRLDANTGASASLARTITTKAEDRNSNDGWDLYKNSRSALVWRCDVNAQPQIVFLPWESIITDDEDVDVAFNFDNSQTLENTWETMTPDGKSTDTDREFSRGHRAPSKSIIPLTRAALQSKTFRLTIFDNGGGVYSKRYTFSLEGLSAALSKLPCFVKAGVASSSVKPPITPAPNPGVKPAPITPAPNPNVKPPVMPAPITSSPNPSTPLATALLAKARAAHGGAALDAIKTYVERSQLTVLENAQSATLEVTSIADIASGTLRAEYNLNGQRVLIAQASPTEAWQWTAQNGVQPMAEADAQDLRSALYIGWFGLRSSVKPEKAESVSVAGNPALRLTTKDLTVTYSFDANGRIASQSAQTPLGEVTIRLSDYRNVQGVWVPYATDTFLNGTKTRSDRTLEVTINSALGADTFAKP